MCGIAGILGTRRVVQRPILEKIANSLEHRGPDDEGVEVVSVDESQDCYLGLVHRRLSIIDLSSAAHQPMYDPETGNWIVFNGEIYNYREIREVLASDGHSFKSNSDTEVILKAYAQWGEGCLSKLRGMFAFALWDAKQGKLFLVVDRMGIKPLYFCKSSRGPFLFSSEVRALLKSGVIEKEVEPLAVDSFLTYGAVQAPLTMIKGVHALLPAHYLTYCYRSGEIDVAQYWSPKVAIDQMPSDDDRNDRDRFETVLKEAVRNHLVSDVPLGIFLSGGMDSSALAILVSKYCEESGLESFTVTFPESAYSEGKYSQLVANKLSTAHHAIELSESDLQALLSPAMEAMDQPTVDGINVYVIAKAVRERGLKAVLSGQGGDEVFGGYNTFRRIPRLKQFCHWAQTCLGRSQRGRLAGELGRLLQHSTFVSKVAQCMGSDGDLLSLYLISRQLFNPQAKQRLIHTRSEGELRNGIPAETADWLIEEINGLDTFSSISLLEMRCYLGNMLLRDGDVMSMAHGLEIRMPFLDHELVECVFAIPAAAKLRGRIPKPLLLNSIQEEMPKDVYRRSKMGFTFPWEIWLRNKLRYQVDELFHETPDHNEMGLNVEECRNLWRRFLDHKPGMTWARVWALYVLLFWVRRNLST